MRELIESVLACLSNEALPTSQVRRRSLRSAAGEPPMDDEYEAGSAELAAPEPARLPRILDGVRVLVVDDDADTAEVFAAALGACGAEVVVATSARDALRVLAARAVDVVVSDIAMPGADGYWLLREIRRSADARTRAVPVLAATAFGREHAPGRTLAAGFVDHLEKPVDPEALCVAVARAVAR
jgi:CheY-like chemotaxis protein